MLRCTGWFPSPVSNALIVMLRGQELKMNTATDEWRP